MKIDRLLSIVIYLMNHELVTAKELAYIFDVNIRTIQRDMDSLILAGIPLESIQGMNGGYRINPKFKLDNQFLHATDFTTILTALKTLASSIDDEQLSKTLSHVQTYQSDPTQSVDLDLSVAKEGTFVQENIQILKRAIKDKIEICFTYTNKQNQVSTKIIQPLQLKYQWYAWYLIGFSTTKNKYYHFKLARIRDIQILGITFYHDITNLEKKLAQQNKDYEKQFEILEIRSIKSKSILIEEYFQEAKKMKADNLYDFYTIEIDINEKRWLSLLLSFGKGVYIISPEICKEKLIETAKDVLSNYSEGLGE